MNVLEEALRMKKLMILLLILGAGYFGYRNFAGGSSDQLEPLYETPYIVVYGRTTCGWTQKCLRELKAKNYDVIFENIDSPDVQGEIFARIDAAGLDRHRISIPIIDVNGHILIGYELEKILNLYPQ
jgi:arsenate reductase-like glutaredoxin family protein